MSAQRAETYTSAAAGMLTCNDDDLGWVVTCAHCGAQETMLTNTAEAALDMAIQAHGYWLMHRKRDTGWHTYCPQCAQKQWEAA